MVKTTKKGASTAAASKVPAAPWIYINDSTRGGYVTEELAKLIPNTFIVTTFHSQKRLEYRDSLSKAKDAVNIIRDTRNDREGDAKKEAIRIVKAAAIKSSANLVSINIINDPFVPQTHIELGGAANHLNLIAGPGSAHAIYKWLFNVLTVRETLYLLSDDEMQQTDTKLFPEYEYCPINQANARPKNAKIQFVCLILTKPQVTEGKRLSWTVVDKSGSANFYFQYRGPHSQFTWDWVMNLQPGERKALPRMPMVQIKERMTTRVVKAPFRAVGAVILTAGLVLKQVGKGVSKVGKATKMGSSSEWVPEADVDTNGKKIDWNKDTEQSATNGYKQTKIPAKKTEESNEKVWDDAASDASTEAGTETSHDKMKDFL